MPLPIVLQGEERNPSGTMSKITQFSMAIPIILDLEPKSSNSVLLENQWGLYSGSLYVAVNGKVYRLTSTENP